MTTEIFETKLSILRINLRTKRAQIFPELIRCPTEIEAVAVRLSGRERLQLNLDRRELFLAVILREWRRHHPDRKSTRLNSSHLVISYAVFCLKKNRNLHPRPRDRPSATPHRSAAAAGPFASPLTLL